MGVFPMRCPLFEAAGNGPCDSEAMINLMGPYCIGLSTDSRGLKGFHFLVLMVQGSSDQQSHCFFCFRHQISKEKDCNGQITSKCEGHPVDTPSIRTPDSWKG